MPSRRWEREGVGAGGALAVREARHRERVGGRIFGLGEPDKAAGQMGFGQKIEATAL
jgi:hypothetical protein